MPLPTTLTALVARVPRVGPAMAQRLGVVPGPQRGATPVGLEMNSQRVRLVSLSGRSTAGHPVVGQAVELVLPRAAMVGSDVVDPDGVADEIAQVLEDLRIARPRASVVVGASHANVRRLNLPRSSHTEALRAISVHPQFKAGVDPEGLTFDVHLIEPNGSTPSMPVLGVAARKDPVRVRQQIALESGMAVDCVELDGFALYNAALLARRPNPLGRAVLVDIGPDQALICVADHLGPTLVRTVELGLAALVRAISDEGLVTAEDAERIILSGKDPGGVAADRYKGWIDALAGEIHTAAASLRAGGTGLPILASGYLPMIEGLTDRLTSELRLPVEPLDLLQLVEVEAGVQLTRKHEGALYTLALGAALRQVMT